MTGKTLRQARKSLGLTQVEVADQLGVSQSLLSQMEKGSRAITRQASEKAVKYLHAAPEELPVSPEVRHNDDQLAADLGSLGYPGYSYLHSNMRNPAEVLFDALDRSDLDVRVVEALPWVVLRYPEMDWDWLTAKAKLNDRQNRLGFVVALAANVAKGQRSKRNVAKHLHGVLKPIEEGRLAKNDTLCQESWPPSQRRFARKQRSPLAAHWKLDTRLTENDLAYATT